ncbi:hypothetical protein J7384_13740 [Endozoicomonas sp. G2_1]|uniref:hypothetical protein n=1 Tax=Endozoicomonas sp. G2_1 TaxID=2821091 RepID=UPI001ADA1B45|nr:hypothetical protein [Endozoicomonas sp. G2_1]MBO9491424.1 hypothetical protein [Endozoicomonas sp. G2_1]
MPDYKKEWMERSAIDYFSPFISLWLACNSWYMSHYSDLHDNHAGDAKASDRDFINKLKEDTSGRNHLYGKFITYLSNSGKDGISFRTDLELLHYALERAELKPERINKCSMLNAVVNYSDKENTTKLIENPRINQDGSVHANDIDTVTKLDQIYVTSNHQNLFAGIFEIIYQVRNMLVHGKLNPDKDEHEVVKYCYRILWAVMS